MEKVCPRCGAHFVCRHDQIADCHCVNVPLDDVQRRFVAENYDDCLCNRCLTIVQEDFYSHGVHPQYCKAL